MANTVISQLLGIYQEKNNQFSKQKFFLNKTSRPTFIKVKEMQVMVV